MRKLVLTVMAILLAFSAAAAQEAEHHKPNQVELRLGLMDYNSQSYKRELPKKLLFQVHQITEGHEHELAAGIGYKINLSKHVTVTPSFLGVISNHDQRGAMPALGLELESEKWEGSADLAYYLRIKGHRHSGAVLENAELVRAINASKFSAGIAGRVRRDDHHKWETRFGPLIKRRDSKGAWGLSFLFGSKKEISFSRSFKF